MKKLALIFLGLSIGLYCAHLISSPKGQTLTDGLGQLKLNFSDSAHTQEKVVNALKTSVKKNQEKIKGLSTCFKQKKCGVRKDARFFDPRLSPELTKISKKLERIEARLAIDPGALDEIDSEILKETLTYKHKSSFALASSILMRKDPNNLAEIAAGEFSGREVGLFFDLFQGRGQLSPEERKILDQKVGEFLQQDNFTVLNTLDELNEIALDVDQWSQIRSKSCKRLNEIKDHKKIFEAKFKRLARKYEVGPKACSS